MPRRKIEVKLAPITLKNSTTVLENFSVTGGSSHKNSVSETTITQESHSSSKESESTDTESHTSSKESESCTDKSVTTVSPSTSTCDESDKSSRDSESTITESSWTSVSSGASTATLDCDTSTESESCRSNKDSCHPCSKSSSYSFIECGGDFCVKDEVLLIVTASLPASIILPCCQIYGYGNGIKIIIKRPAVCHSVSSRDNVNSKPGKYFIGRLGSTYTLYATSKGWISDLL
jgi:hypothetical protein